METSLNWDFMKSLVAQQLMIWSTIAKIN